MANTTIRNRSLEGIGTEWTCQFVVCLDVSGTNISQRKTQRQALVGACKVLVI
jgi:hypothetical protein